MASEPTEDHQAAIQVILAEFGALRKEIGDRSSAATTLLNINITASATVVGFVLSNKASPLLLLLLPILSPALGMLFVDHAYNILNLGDYIKETLAPELRNMTGHRGLLGYEERIDTYEQSRIRRFLPLGLPVALTFALSPIAALFFSIRSLETPWSWAIWAFGLVMVIIYLYLWIIFLLIPYQRFPIPASRPAPDSSSLREPPEKSGRATS
jgi:hypothetical protein